MGVDTKCVDLAEHFLEGEKIPALREAVVDSLARRIQQAVEDWFDDMEREMDRVRQERSHI